MRIIYCDVCGEPLKDPLFDGLAGRPDVRAACPNVKDVCPSCARHLKGFSAEDAVLSAWRDKAGLAKRRGKKGAAKPGKPMSTKPASNGRPGRKPGRPKADKSGAEPSDDGDAEGHAGEGDVSVIARPEPVQAQACVQAPEPEPVRVPSGPAVRMREPVPSSKINEPVPPDKPGPGRGRGFGRNGGAGSGAPGTSGRHPVRDREPDPLDDIGRHEQPARPARMPRYPRSSSEDAALKSRVMQALRDYRASRGIGSLQALAAACDDVGVDELRRALSAERFEVDWWKKVEAGLRSLAEA